MAAMCPHCGYSLTADQPLVAGRWTLLPNESYLDGKRLELTPQQAAVLYAIAKGKGHPVSAYVIMNRVSDSDSGSTNIAHVLVSRLRQRLPEVPFVTERGRGFRWKGEN